MTSEMDWWVSFRHPKDIWVNHPSFLIGEIAFYLIGLLTLRHAVRLGGRFIYLWLATMFHGITCEALSYFLPDIDSFWHAQSMVMLLGKRLPLHIVFAYPVFIYTSSIAVSRLNLKRSVEPFAVGLATVLVDVPFDIMGIKLLWWTWHDTDPNVYERTYWVPWTSYFFHASFASSVTIIFHGSRRLLSDKEKFQSDGFCKEIVCAVLTGLFSFPLGTLQFICIYHSLHDNFAVNSEVCFFVLLVLYAIVIWTGDRNPDKEARAVVNKGWFDEIYISAFLHFSLYIIFVLVRNPETIRSVGLHETTGNCNQTTPVHTAFGQILSKKTFLCVSDYDEGYYDFHCTDLPKDGAQWYTVCGTGFGNHLEYCVVVMTVSLLGIYVFTQMLIYSGKQPKTTRLGPRPATPKIKRQ